MATLRSDQHPSCLLSLVATVTLSAFLHVCTHAFALPLTEAIEQQQQPCMRTLTYTHMHTRMHMYMRVHKHAVLRHTRKSYMHR